MLEKVEYCETFLQPMKTQMGKNNKQGNVSSSTSRSKKLAKSWQTQLFVIIIHDYHHYEVQ